MDNNELGLYTLVKNLPMATQIKLCRPFFGNARKAAFFQRMKDGIDNGQQLTATLDIMRMFYEKHASMEAVIVHDMLQVRKQGGRDVELLMKWLSAEEILLMRTGEQAGLSQALERCIRMANRKEQLFNTLISELSGPLGKIAFVIILLVGISHFILPDMLKVARHNIEDGNMASYVLFTMGKYIDSWWSAVIAAVFIGIVSLVMWSFKHWTGSLRKIFDKLPPWSTYRVSAGVTWLSSVSLMIASNMTIQKALDETASLAKSSNPWLYERVRSISKLYGSRSFGMAFVESGYQFPDPDLVDEMEMYSKQNVPQERYLKLADDWAAKGEISMRAQIRRFGAICNGIYYGMFLLFGIGIFAFTQDMTVGLTQAAV